MSIIIQGFEELHRKLIELTQLRLNGKNIARKGMRAAAKPIVQAFQVASPDGPPWRRAKARMGVKMRQAVGTRFITSVNSKKGGIGFKAGFNIGKSRKSSRRAPHAHLVLLGTVDRFTRTGAFRGRVQRENQNTQRVRAAVNAAVPRSVEILSNELREALQ